MPYRMLDPEKIIATADILRLRIAERFDGSGLSKVGAELVSLSHDTKHAASDLEKPILWLRILVFIAVFAGAITFFFVGRFLTFDRISNGAFDFVQGMEATINTLVLLGLGLFTLATAEERIKRQRVLKGLHSLRSLIHVIDMHQLTKDPVSLSSSFVRTKSSPKRELSAADLSRYLDYCSEMLSITGKLAALYSQAVPDMEVVNAVNDVESLGANLSRKIWQKIILIEPEILRNRTGRAVKSAASKSA